MPCGPGRTIIQGGFGNVAASLASASGIFHGAAVRSLSRPRRSTATGAIGPGGHRLACDDRPGLVRPVHRAATDYAIRHVIRDPRRPGASVSRTEDGTEPRRILDREQKSPVL